MGDKKYFTEEGRKTNICIDCKKACGGCSWSEIDPSTEKQRFQPVEGWTAEPAVLTDCGRVIHTFHITACPEFEADEQRKGCRGEVTLEQIEAMMARWRRKGGV